MDAPDTTNPLVGDRLVEDRLRALDPPDTWEPATSVALAHFHERAAAAAAPGLGLRLRSRLRRRQLVYATHQISGPVSSPTASRFRGLLSLSMRGRFEGGRAPTWIAAATMAFLLLLLTPVPRTAAHRLWDVFFAERVEFVRLDVDKLPRSLTEQKIRMNGANKEVASIQEAAGYAGFMPRLPDGSLAAAADGDPRFQVAGAISVESQVNVFELEAAARHARLFDVHFPPAWDGARIAVHSSPIVIADYMSFQLMQVMPLAITTPPDFDLGAFTERVLRIGGLTPDEARRFSTQMTSAPFALCAISLDEKVTMGQVRLRAGEGTIVHDLNEDGTLQRTTLVWSTPDRLYVISSYLSDDEVIAIADAVPQR